jgi:hypothetical protein
MSESLFEIGAYFALGTSITAALIYLGGMTYMFVRELRG